MIEILIGLAVMGVALASYMQIKMRESDVLNARELGQEMAGARALMAQYFLSNRTEMIAAMGADDASDTNVQTHCVIRVPDPDADVDPGTTSGSAGPNGTLAWSGGAGIDDGLKTCAVDLSLLQAKGLAGRNLNFRGGHNIRYVGIFKRVRGPGTDGVLGNSDDELTEDVEMLMVAASEDGTLNLPGQTALDRERMMASAQAMGQSGGVFPVGQLGACTANDTTTTICGQGWQVDLSEWLSPGQLATVQSALPSASP